MNLYFRKGSILIATVWMLVIFSILGIMVYKITSAQLNLSKRLEQRAAGMYLAMAAYQYAKLFREMDDTSYDTLYELRTEQKRKLGRGSFIYAIVDEESKINLNKASEEVLSRLPGLNPELAKAIIKYRRKPFQLVEEVQLVEGITKEMFLEFRGFITTYGSGAVNINTASPEVLKILGMDYDLVSIIQEYRAGSDGVEGTEDDGVFENIGSILNDLRSFTSLTEAQEALLLQLNSQRWLGVGSENLGLEVQTFYQGAPAVNYHIVMRKKGVEQWREY